MDDKLQLEVRRARPGLRLGATLENLKAQRDGNAVLKVDLVREVGLVGEALLWQVW